MVERCGHATASEFATVRSKGKGSEEAVGRRNYRVRVAIERLTGVPQDSGYRNAAMDHGQEFEAEARAAYEVHTGRLVREVGFIKHQKIAWCGASPDGVADDRIIEIKCPLVSAIHVETLLANRLPPEHVAQVQGEMWVADKGLSDFVSYDPRMPEGLRLFIFEAKRDEAYIREFEPMLRQFLAEVMELVEQLAKRASDV
ncbi:MAG: lambda exonuclease family protein [Thermoanaerobaculia bacterium]